MLALTSESLLQGGRISYAWRVSDRIGQKVSSEQVRQDHFYRMYTQLPGQECTNSTYLQEYSVPAASHWPNPIWWSKDNS